MSVTKTGKSITFDFSNSDPGRRTQNGRPHCAGSMLYVMIAITGIDTPVNQGVFDCFKLETREGTVVDLISQHRLIPTTHVACDY